MSKEKKQEENTSSYGELKIAKLKEALLNSAYHVEKYKIGKILTVIDSCIADHEQRKAIKDLIKESYWGDDRDCRHYEFNDILSEYDSITLKELNNDYDYRIFMNAPTELRKKEDMNSPRCAKYFNK